MIIVFNPHAAVVQARRDFQYFQILTGKLMQYPKLLEELNGQMHHVFHVLGIAIVLTGVVIVSLSAEQKEKGE